MIPENYTEFMRDWGVPRVGGGDPIPKNLTYKEAKCSPRRRG